MSLALTLSKATVNYTPGTLYNIPVSAVQAITNGMATRFPVPWPSQSSDPGMQITVVNNSTSAPISPILMDIWVSAVDGKTYYYTFAELTTVQPGASLTETVAGIPCTQMWLALPYLAVSVADSAAGWTVNVSALGV